MKPCYETNARLLGISRKLAIYEDWKRKSPDKNERPVAAFSAMMASA